MKPVFYAYMITVLVLSACSSGKSTFERGNYYEAVITSVNRLRRNSDHKKSVETLRQAYPMAVAFYEERAKTSLASSEPFKWTEVVNSYTTINVMHDEIKRCPGALAVVPNPVNYYSKLQEARQNAAEEHYAAGIVALQFGDREHAKKAYGLFKTANDYVAGYKDVNNYLEAALAAATVKVLVEPIPVHSKSVGVSAEFFNDKISEFVHSAPISEFVRFYTRAETEKLKVKPDHIIQLQFDDFTVGQVYKHEKEIQLTKDSVELGTYVTAATSGNSTTTGQKANFVGTGVLASGNTSVTPVTTTGTNSTSNTNTNTTDNTGTNTSATTDAARAQAERERLEKESAARALAEQQRLEKEQADKALAEKSAAERERLAREAAAAKAAAEKAAADKAAAEKAAADKAAADKAAADKAAADKAAADKAAADKAAADKAAADKAAADKAAADKAAADKAAADKAAADKAAADKAAADKAAADKAAADKAAAEKAAADKAAAEKAAADKAAADKAAADKAAADRAKAEREAADKAKADREKAEKDKAANAKYVDPSINREDTLNVKDGVTICHIPPGNKANARTLHINRSALKAHLAHGDSEGDCSGEKEKQKGKADDGNSKPADKNDKPANENKGNDKKGSGKINNATGEHAMLSRNEQLVLASAETDPYAFLRYLEIPAADTNKVYGTVKATLYHFSKTTTSKGVVSFRIIDAKTGALLTAEKLPGEYVWVSEWATFNGDERALTPEQLKLTKLKEQPAPAPQDLFIEFTRPIYDQITTKVREFYKGY